MCLLIRLICFIRRFFRIRKWKTLIDENSRAAWPFSRFWSWWYRCLGWPLWSWWLCGWAPSGVALPGSLTPPMSSTTTQSSWWPAWYFFTLMVRQIIISMQVYVLILVKNKSSYKKYLIQIISRFVANIFHLKLSLLCCSKGNATARVTDQYHFQLQSYLATLKFRGPLIFYRNNCFSS